jgi:hypothetical protein
VCRHCKTSIYQGDVYFADRIIQCVQPCHSPLCGNHATKTVSPVHHSCHGTGVLWTFFERNRHTVDTGSATRVLGAAWSRDVFVVSYAIPLQDSYVTSGYPSVVSAMQIIEIIHDHAALTHARHATLSLHLVRSPLSSRSYTLTGVTIKGV